MSVPTTQQLLDQLNTALHEILSGQAAEKVITLKDGSSQRFTALDIEQLQKLRNQLKAEVSASSQGRTAFASFLPKGRFSV